MSAQAPCREIPWCRSRSPRRGIIYSGGAFLEEKSRRSTVTTASKTMSESFRAAGCYDDEP